MESEGPKQDAQKHLMQRVHMNPIDGVRFVPYLLTMNSGISILELGLWEWNSLEGAPNYRRAGSSASACFVSGRPSMNTPKGPSNTTVSTQTRKS